MENKPFVSIITVVFNGASLLEKTIESVASQTVVNYEYIIIDGGSTDGTIGVIKKHEPTIAKWISEPDKGLYDAMNKGLQLSRGEFVWFMNAGDLLNSDTTLQQLLLCYQQQPADIFYGGTIIIGENGEDIGSRRQHLPEKLNWRSFQHGMVVSHQSILIKRILAPNYNLNYTCSADIDWVIASLKSASLVVNTHLILSRFLDGGRSKSTILPSLKERFSIMRKYYGLLPTLWHHIPIAFRFFLFLFRYRRF